MSTSEITEDHIKAIKSLIACYEGRAVFTARCPLCELTELSGCHKCLWMRYQGETCHTGVLKVLDAKEVPYVVSSGYGISWGSLKSNIENLPKTRQKRLDMLYEWLGRALQIK